MLYLNKCFIADVELPVACVILICLFALQHYGTNRVGFLFAPVVITWLLCISTIGLYNIIHWNPHIYKALSPHYMYVFLKKTQGGGWMSLGGILLCITGRCTIMRCSLVLILAHAYWSLLIYYCCTLSGSEAMFADLGHFSQLSIQVSILVSLYVVSFQLPIIHLVYKSLKQITLSRFQWWNSTYIPISYVNPTLLLVVIGHNKYYSLDAP